MRSGKLVASCMSLVALFVIALALLVPVATAQETTASMQGYVKDPSGAAIPGATVEITSTALEGSKKLQTDSSGYYHFYYLPPGEYTLTVSATNFRTYKQTGIKLEVGRLPTIDVQLEIGAVTQLVEVSGKSPIVDVTTSKAAVTVSQEIINMVPKGRSFQSLIPFAPGARYEPLMSTVGGRAGGYAGYQIDGASNSENSFLIDGQETSDVRSGQSKTNAPFEFVQQVQVKSSGFEAEYGGALGGVVNVVQKRGGNAWHGSVITYYQGDPFNANPSVGSDLLLSNLRKNPNIPANTGGPRLDQPSQYYITNKDHFRVIEPGVEVGGYVMKDRIWVYGGFIPRFETRTRNVNFTSASPTPGPRNLFQNSQVYYSSGRVDVLATKKIRLFGSIQYAYERGSGANSAGSTLPNADSVSGLSNASATQNADNFRPSIGYVAPNVIYGVGGEVTLSPRLVASSRLGYFYNDLQDRGLPQGIRYQYRDSNYNYPAQPGAASTPSLCPTFSTTGGCPTLGTVAPAFVQNIAGFSNIASNFTQVFDRYRRLTFAQDVAYFGRGFFGTHNFKFGYTLNRLGNDTNQSFNTAQAYIAYGQEYFPLTANQPVCAAIRAQNITRYGDPGTLTNESCRGLWGTFNIREGNEVFGYVKSNNHGLYVQDSWTLGATGVTLNLGIRFDKEHLPSYDAAQKFPGIDFDFTQKIAPRLGAAWDVMRNGKLKVYGSYGKFFDIMKYSLPRGSFGGDYWHDCVYTLDDPDWTKIIPLRTGPNNYFCGTSGPAFGTIPATSGRFIENQDFRQPSNDPSNFLIDPNLKPMKQHEIVLGADWAIKSNLGLEIRYSRKRLDRTIEDAGIVTPSGETFFIVNPGEGIHTQPIPATDCVPGKCPGQPNANRRYDGLEFRLTKRASSRWYASVSYTYSRLYGNYSGLTSTDVSDGQGRSDPNNNRAFDEPFMQYDSHGKLIDGPLATDRPHAFKGFVWYRLKWWGMETSFGATQQWFSGTPLSSYVAGGSGAGPVFVEGRGNFAVVTRDPATGNWVLGGVQQGRRTPMFSQSDFNFLHEFKVSKTNEALRVGVEANIFNLFNQKAAIGFNQKLIRTGKLTPNVPGNVPLTSVSGDDFISLLTGWNYITQANSQRVTLNSLYGLPNLFQASRSMRFKFKFTF